MPVATAAASATYERDGFAFHPLAVPSRGSAELAIWTLDVPAGAESEPHSMDREEVFVTTSGRLTATIDGVQLAAGPGDALIVPAHAVLRLRNPGGRPARATVITSAGMTATVGGAAFTPPWAQ
jgi:mannose-6-phosphate isomerase-like protein (cupin superfamily)